MSNIVQTVEVMRGRVWLPKAPDTATTYVWLSLTEHPANEMELNYYQVDKIGDDFQRFMVLRPPDINSRTFQELLPIDESLPFVIIRHYDIVLPIGKHVSDMKLRLLVKVTFQQVWVEGYRCPSAHGYEFLEEINFLSGDFDTRSYAVDAAALQMQARMGGIKSTTRAY